MSGFSWLAAGEHVVVIVIVVVSVFVTVVLRVGETTAMVPDTRAAAAIIAAATYA
jgi:hypothetical protein